MEFNLGPYKMIQRTPYSKIHVYDTNDNKDITDSYISKELIASYTAQTSNPDAFFEIEEGCLNGIKNNAKNMKYIFIPETVDTIGRMAFKKEQFEFVGIPETVKEIEGYAFYGCKLKSLIIPDSVLNIGAYTFSCCKQLKDIKLSNNLEKITERLFFECDSLTSIKIPDSVLRIDAEVFRSCISLKNVKLSKNLNFLGAYAFCDCFSLGKITFSEGLEQIRKYCFACCKSLNEIIIPDSVNYIGDRCFEGCEKIKKVKLPSETTIIRDGLFYSCVSLEELILPDSVSTIGVGAFANTKKLKSINIPEKLMSASGFPFIQSGLKEVKFNYDLNSFKNAHCALTGMSHLDKIIISKNVNRITPDFFGISKYEEVETLDYLGTKKEFNEFKKNNKDFFKKLPNLQKINIIEDIDKDIDKDLSK